jgi:hypothetical protein
MPPKQDSILFLFNIIRHCGGYFKGGEYMWGEIEEKYTEYYER